jgi:hypothetical protein
MDTDLAKAIEIVHLLNGQRCDLLSQEQCGA